MNYIKLHDIDNDKNIVLVNFNQVLYFTKDVYSKHTILFFEDRRTLFVLETIEEIENKIKEAK